MDSSASLEVLSALRDMTQLGMNIIMVIHQPRFSIVELFHEMLLLGKGGVTVFKGSSAQALNYFSHLGFQMAPNENPADVFLDIISGEVRRDGDRNFQPGDLFKLWEQEGEWVRQGEFEPPNMKENEDESAGEGEGEILIKDGQFDAVNGPPKSSRFYYDPNFLSPILKVINSTGMLRSPFSAGSSPTSIYHRQTPIGRLNINTVTTPSQFRPQPYQTHRPPRFSTRGGGEKTPAAPADPLPSTKSPVLANHSNPSMVVLPPMVGDLTQRSHTAGSDFGATGNSHLFDPNTTRSPPMSRGQTVTSGMPHNYPFTHLPTHRRTRSQFNILSAYRAGVTSAAELPLPKHRELLNKLGPDGIEKLVVEFEEYQHHPPQSPLNRFISTPMSRSKSPPASQQHRHEYPMRTNASRPPTSVRNLNILFDAANPSAQQPYSSKFPHASSRPLTRQQSNETTHTPNIVSHSTSQQAHKTPSINDRSQRGYATSVALNVSPNLIAEDESYQYDSVDHDHDHDHERTPLSPGDRDRDVSRTHSDAWKHTLPSGSPRSYSSHNEPSSQSRSHGSLQKVEMSTTIAAASAVPSAHKRQNNIPLKEGDIFDGHALPTGRTHPPNFLMPPQSQMLNSGSSSFARTNPSGSPVSQSYKIKFDDDNSANDSPHVIAELEEVQLTEFQLHQYPQPKAPLHTSPMNQSHDAHATGVASSSNGDVSFHPTPLPSSTGVTRPSLHHPSRSTGYHPALASIPSDGELDSGRSRGSASTSPPSSTAVDGVGVEVDANHTHSMTTVLSPRSGTASRSPPTISLMSPVMRPHVNSVSPMSVHKDQSIGMNSASHMGVLPGAREVPLIYTQFGYLIERQSLKLMRNINDVAFDMSLTTAVGLAIGLIFGGVWSLSGYATISVMAVLSLGVLSAVSSLKMFGHDRVVFWRESAAGISITAYWLAVTLLHIPLNLILSFLFVAPYYNLILPDVSLLETWWIFIGVYFACSGGGMLLSVCFKPIPALLSGVMIPLIMGGFLNGVSPRLSEMNGIMRFLCDISYSRYGVESLMIQQLNIQPDYARPIVDEIYEGFGFVATHLQFTAGMLFTIGCVLRVATLIALHTLNRDKRV